MSSSADWSMRPAWRKFQAGARVHIGSRLGHCFQKAVIVHPGFAVFLAKNGNAARSQERELENFPLRVRYVVVGSCATLFPNNRYFFHIGHCVVPESGNAAKVPLEILSLLLRLCKLQRICPAMTLLLNFS